MVLRHEHAHAVQESGATAGAESFDHRREPVGHVVAPRPTEEGQAARHRHRRRAQRPEQRTDSLGIDGKQLYSSTWS